MLVINPSFSFIDEVNGEEILKKLEKIGRTCYKSEDRITEESAKTFLRNIIKRGHESVIEHHIISVRIICDRGVSHEIVRHRLASFSQESTRYCNYSKDKFDGQLTFIKPSFFEEGSFAYKKWEESMLVIEKNYLDLIEEGIKPEQARTILPNSLKTDIVVTMNLRNWRNFFKLRCDASAHPQIREIAIPLLQEFNSKIPVIFEDLI